MGLKIENAVGKLSEQNVEGIINSSNSYLILGSGTAGDTRDAGGYLENDDKHYWSLVRKASYENPILGKVLEHVHSNGRQPSKAQLERLEYLSKRDFKALRRGDAVLFSSCDLAEIPYKADYVCDGVGMDYKWKVQPNPPVIKATLNSVSSSLYKSLILLANKGCESIAIPRGMCSRKGGLPEEISSLARHIALSKIIEELTPIKKIVIVGPDYSTSSKER